MNRAIRLFIFIIILFLSMPSTILAWDGKRQGFLLGLGAGIGQVSYHDVQHDKVGPDPEDEDTTALAFMPKLGYAFTDQFALIYSRHPFNFETTNSDDEKANITACVESLELHYYFSSDAPTVYLGIGTGNSYFFQDEMNEPEALKGNGSMASIGFEFSTHYSLEVTYTSAQPQSGAEVVAIAVTLSALGY